MSRSELLEDPIHGFLFEGSGFPSSGIAAPGQTEGFVTSVWVRAETGEGARGIAIALLRPRLVGRWGEMPDGVLRLVPIGRTGREPDLEPLERHVWWTGLSVHADGFFSRLRKAFGQFRIRL